MIDSFYMAQIHEDEMQLKQKEYQQQGLSRKAARAKAEQDDANPESLFGVKVAKIPSR